MASTKPGRTGPALRDGGAAGRGSSPRDFGLRDFRLRGFTLIEVLVVIAIVGVLTGLLLPALQSAREAARGAHCANNLKQIGVAIAHYESSAERYPPGVLVNFPYKGSDGKPDTSGFYSWTSFLHMIMPQLDEQVFYDGVRGPRFPVPGLNLTDAAANQKNFAKVNGIAVPPLLCPSDTQAPATWRAATLGDIRLAKSNYLCFFSGTTTGDGLELKKIGVEVAWPVRPVVLPEDSAAKRPSALTRFDRRAAFGYGLGTTAKMIKDGTANTIAVAEYLKGVSETDGRGAFWWTDAGMQFLKANHGPNSATPDQFDRARTGIGLNDVRDWGCRGASGIARSPNNNPTINLPCRPGANRAASFASGNPISTNDEFASPRSRHRGGVYALYCDGHVDFIEDGIDSRNTSPYGSWQRLVWIDDESNRQ